MLVNNHIKSASRLKTLAYLIAVEVEDVPQTPSPDEIGEKLAGGLTWVEGVGRIEVTCLGEMDEEEVEATMCLENA